MTQHANNLSFTRAATVDRFGSAMEGSPEAFFLVVASPALGAGSRAALEKSAAALGWKEAPTYLFVGAPPVSSKADLFEAIEGLDPIAVVVAGRQAMDLAKEAYGVDLPANDAFRLFGRDACAFEDLDSLLQTDAGKQSAWSTLKALGHKAP